MPEFPLGDGEREFVSQTASVAAFCPLHRTNVVKTLYRRAEAANGGVSRRKFGPRADSP
jgi:hypothetical protein